MAGLGRIWVGAGSAAGWPDGWRVHHVEQTGSTNADLLAAYEAGDAGDRFVLASDHQTDGRGRLDRRWDAPPGTGLLVSMLFETVPEVPVHVTWRVGLAAVSAVRRLSADGLDSSARVGLKWPNDVLLDDRKLAGVLARRAANGAVVVGIGLNVSWAPPGAAQLGDDIGPSAVLRQLLTDFDALPDEIGELYHRELLTLGREVKIELPGDRVVSGTALDVDPTGRLVVRDGSGSVHHFDAGDVVHAHTVS
jgi:BirA family biotin operon repressor/biotin-[acetyl-CoA-carboxylase] ligase